MANPKTFNVSWWKRMLKRLGFYQLKPDGTHTTIIVEIENATGAIAVNKIQDINFKLVIDAFERIIKLSK